MKYTKTIMVFVKNKHIPLLDMSSAVNAELTLQHTKEIYSIIERSFDPALDNAEFRVPEWFNPKPTKGSEKSVDVILLEHVSEIFAEFGYGAEFYITDFSPMLSPSGGAEN